MWPLEITQSWLGVGTTFCLVGKQSGAGAELGRVCCRHPTMASQLSPRCCPGTSDAAAEGAQAVALALPALTDCPQGGHFSL